MGLPLISLQLYSWFPLPGGGWTSYVPFFKPLDKKGLAGSSWLLHKVVGSWSSDDYHRIEIHRLPVERCDYKVWTS